jgi:hypothetical protein
MIGPPRLSLSGGVLPAWQRPEETARLLSSLFAEVQPSDGILPANGERQSGEARSGAGIWERHGRPVRTILKLICPVTRYNFLRHLKTPDDQELSPIK